MDTQSPHTPRWSQRFGLLIGSILFTLLVGCRAATPPQPVDGVATPPPAVTTGTATVAPGAQSATAALPAGCEEFFPFCNTVTISGAVTAEGSISSVHKADSCAAWATGASTPRILELPFLVGAGERKITVALTRIGAYAGPGTYPLVAQTTKGMPDMFPTVEVAGRAFSNGADSAATVTVNADGSGVITATGLVEIASVQVASPDPDARIDFAMSWRCKD